MTDCIVSHLSYLPVIEEKNSSRIRYPSYLVNALPINQFIHACIHFFLTLNSDLCI